MCVSICDGSWWPPGVIKNPDINTVFICSWAHQTISLHWLKTDFKILPIQTLYSDLDQHFKRRLAQLDYSIGNQITLASVRFDQLEIGLVFNMSQFLWQDIKLYSRRVEINPTLAVPKSDLCITTLSVTWKEKKHIQRGVEHWEIISY